MSIEAYDYWRFQKGIYSGVLEPLRLTCILAGCSRLPKIVELKEQLRARELASASTPKDKHGRPLVSFMADDTKPEINRTSSQTSSINGPTRKFPKKRPVLASSNKEDSSVSNGAPRRPSSTSSSTHGSIRQSEPSHSSDSRQITNNTKPRSIKPRISQGKCY